MYRRKGEDDYSMEKIKEFEERIEYEFKNKGLLKQALIHSSYANEKHMKKLSDNERLEFLGDAVLELITSTFIYNKYTTYPEGKLTRLRASIVCEQTLAMCAEEIELGTMLFLGKGEDLTGGRTRKSVLSDAFEAVIGAIYLDGGFAKAKEFIMKYVMEDIEKKQLFYDSKTILQEIVQAKPNSTLTYELIKEEGPDHAKTFTIETRISGKTYAVGVGATKKAAEQQAAYETILILRKKG